MTNYERLTNASKAEMAKIFFEEGLMEFNWDISADVCRYIKKNLSMEDCPDVECCDCPWNEVSENQYIQALYWLSKEPEAQD